MMATRTINQSNRFHALIGQHKLDREDKQAIVLQFTGGREKSSAKMSCDEMAAAIDHMEGIEKKSMNRMKAKVINIYREIIDHPNPLELTQAQWDALNKHLLRTCKSPLHKLTYDQLPDAVTSMERWRDANVMNAVGDILGEERKKVGRPRKVPI